MVTFIWVKGQQRSNRVNQPGHIYPWCKVRTMVTFTEVKGQQESSTVRQSLYCDCQTLWYIGSTTNVCLKWWPLCRSKVNGGFIWVNYVIRNQNLVKWTLVASFTGLLTTMVKCVTASKLSGNTVRFWSKINSSKNKGIWPCKSVYCNCISPKHCNVTEKMDTNAYVHAYLYQHTWKFGILNLIQEMAITKMVSIFKPNCLEGISIYPKQTR